MADCLEAYDADSNVLLLLLALALAGELALAYDEWLGWVMTPE